MEHTETDALYYSEYSDEYHGIYNMSNISHNLHSDFLQGVHESATVYAVILCILTIIVNVFVMAVCLKDKDMRQNGYFLQVVNLSVANLIIATFVIPLTVYHVLHEWYLGMTMCKVFVIADVFLPFVSIIIMILLNIDKQISVSHPQLHLWLFQGSLQWVILFIPWFVAFVVVVPIWTSGSIPIQNRPGECMVLVSFEAAILCPVLTYFIPLLTIVFLNFRLLLARLHSTDGTSTLTVSERLVLKPHTVNQTSVDIEETEDQIQNASPVNNSNANTFRVKRDDFSAVCVANLAFCVMWFPYQCTSFLLTICSHFICLPSAELTQVVTWFGTSSACVVPLCWLIDSQMMMQVRACCCGKRSGKKNVQRANNNETYL